MYMRQSAGFGQIGQAGACSALEKDPARFSKLVAEHYLSTELYQRQAAGVVRCRPDNKVCEVTFAGGITIGVSLVRVPAYIIARQMYSRTGAPRREYNYACVAAGRLSLHRRPDIVTIHLIDPTRIFKARAKLGEQFRSKLEAKLNKLDPAWMKQNFFKFQVRYIWQEPSSDEKAGFRRLDFPVYLLDQQHGPGFVLKLMGEHQIPKTVGKTDIYQLAQDGWSSKDTRGVGIPSGNGYRKVVFIKTNRVFDDARDLAQGLVNITSHEIGHAGNRLQHSSTGLMKYPLPLDRDIDFSQNDKAQFLSNLNRLRALSE